MNRRDGLEHGYTIGERPRGDGLLVIRLGVRGEWRARLLAGGRGAEFVDGAGATVLSYTGLRAWDADGRELAARLVAEAGGVRMEVEERGARYPITVDPIVQQAALRGSNDHSASQFGSSAAISGNTLVVGAPGDSNPATGVNPTIAGTSAPGSGAVYVFVRSGGQWTEQAYLKASNTEAGDGFGWSVGVSGDTVVAGARYESSSVSGVNGNQNDNGALRSGAAYVFVRTGGVWSQQAYLKASNPEAEDEFGEAVAISGDTIAVGADDEDSAATGINGNQADNTAPFAGAVYIYARTGVSWVQQAYVKSSNTAPLASFGRSVALDDGTLVAGAVGDGGGGAAFVFVRSGSVWVQQAHLKASNSENGDGFGSAVAISANTIVAGSPGEASAATGVNGDETNNALPGSGAAYVFVRSGATWSQQAYLKASNAGFFDSFGTSVAVSGDSVVAGAKFEASGARGVNGNQFEDSGPESGAAYLFTRSGGAWTQRAYLKASDASRYFGYSVAAAGESLVVGAALSRGVYVFVNSPSLPQPATISAVAGTPQTAPAGATFQPLTAVVRDAGGNPLSGYTVTFTAPASGPGAVFPSGSTATAVTGSDGAAVAPALTAGPTPGSYTVTAAIAGAAAPANFSLTNTACTFAVNPPAVLISSGAEAPIDITVTATPGCPWTASASESWIAFTGATSGVGSGTVTFRADASEGRAGVITVGGIGVPVNRRGSSPFATPFPAAPYPTSGSGESRLFTFTFDDGNGFADLNVLNVLIRNAVDGRDACYLAYVRSTGTLVLVNDAGQEGGPYAGSVTLPGTGTIANSQCAVDAAKSSVVAGGSTLALNLHLTLRAPLRGNQIVYQAARDNTGNNSGWQAMGVWNVPGGTPAGNGTSVIGLQRTRYEGPQAAGLIALFADEQGVDDFSVVNVLINSTLDARNACYLAYVRATNTLVLVNDAGDAGGPYAGSATIRDSGGSPLNITNTQCRVAQAEWATPAGLLRLGALIAFEPPFRGNHVIWLAARDNAGNNTGWQAAGTITVP